MKRLQSRKLWVTVAIAALVAFSEQLGLALSADQLWSLAATVGLYNVGQGIADRGA